MKPNHLRCEYRRDPLGIDILQPQLSWTLQTDSSARGLTQSAYHVLVSSSLEKLANQEGDLWDSGKVLSDRQLFISYAGRPLNSAEYCYWKVRVWDGEGRGSSWSAPAQWSMGILRPQDWQGQWIAATDRSYRSATSGLMGYHAVEATKADEEKWVQVDLGNEYSVDEVKLYPPVPSGFKRVKGFGFPVRFRIELSNDPEFRLSKILTDFTKQDYRLAEGETPSFKMDGVHARYVRVIATRLWDRKTGPSPFCFALAEVEVWSQGSNVARGRNAGSKDSIENAEWSLSRLTDGDRLLPNAETASNDPKNAAVLLRKEVLLTKSVRRATAFLCGLGYSELEINGRKIGDEVLDPAFTDFSRRVYYRTFDVTDSLRPGTNVLGVTLGGGWFNLATPDLFGFEHAPWASSPRVLCRIDFEYSDGTKQTVVSDGSWKWSTGAIAFNCVRGGETIDAREEKTGWCRAEFDDSAWHSALIVEPPAGKLVSQQHPPIRATAAIRPIKLTEPKPGVYVFDLGANISGWAKLSTRGPRGSKITLEYNELLNSDGTVNTKHLTSHTYGRFQTDEFLLKGEGVESFEPRFTYHGFQYVQVSGLSEKPTLDSLTGRWVHTDFESAGSFSCSNQRINELQQLFLRTVLNNMHGIPTDCPQREKMGWLEDGCVCMDMASFNFNTPLFYWKWFLDMKDAQDPSGHVPDIVPTCGWGRSAPDGSPGAMADPWWGGAVVMTPWKLFLHYGDRRILQEAYPNMKAYVDYLGSTSQDHFISWGLGDWLVGSANAGAPDPIFSSTAAYAYQASMVSRTAALLGKTDDARRYAELAERIRDAFNKKFLNPETGWYVSNSQTGQALPLALDLAPLNLRRKIMERLEENIVRSRQGHVGTGIVGLLFLYQTLMENERDDLIFLMLTREDFPGWLHMINSGATSIWEAWNGDGSRNHPTLGCIGAWFYQGLGGIRLDPLSPAFKRFILKPAVVGDLTWVKCSYPSLYGLMVSNWNREGKKFRWEFTVPINTMATVYVPTNRLDLVTESGRPIRDVSNVKFLRIDRHAAVFEVGSGSYQFESVLFPKGTIEKND